MVDILLAEFDIDYYIHKSIVYYDISVLIHAGSTDDQIREHFKKIAGVDILNTVRGNLQNRFNGDFDYNPRK